MPALSFIAHCTVQPPSMPLWQIIFGHLAPRSEEASPPGPTAVPRLSSIVSRAEGTGLEKD